SAGKLATEMELVDTLKQVVVYGDAGLETAALRAAVASFPTLMLDPEALSVPRWALLTAAGKSVAAVPEGLLSVSLELALTQPALQTTGEVLDALDRLIGGRDAKIWRLVLDAAARNPGARQNLRVVSLIADALGAKDKTLARQAREIVRRNPDLERNPGIAAAFAESARRDSRPAASSGTESYRVGPESAASNRRS